MRSVSVSLAVALLVVAILVLGRRSVAKRELPTPGVEPLAPAPATSLREPDAFFRNLFHELGVLTWSECELAAGMKFIHRSSLDADEEVDADVDLRARRIYEYQHFHCLVTIEGGAGTFEGGPDPPFGLDANLERYEVEETTELGRKGIIVYVVPTAPDRADVDLFQVQGEMQPNERCLTAELRDGCWHFEREYASFAEIVSLATNGR